MSEIITAKKKTFKLSLKKITERFFIKYGIPGIKRKIINIIKGSSEKMVFYVEFFYCTFGFCRHKKVYY